MIPHKFLKNHEISLSNIKPFLSYAQKTTLGAQSAPPTVR